MGQNIISSGRLYLALGLASALLLSGCDQKKSAPSAAPSTPTTAPANVAVVPQPPPVAVPDRNRPPTDAEVLAAILGFWRDRGSGWNVQLVTPIGAEQADNAMTQDVMGTKVRTVTVTYTFQAKSDLTYICQGGRGEVLSVSPAPNQPMNSFPNPVSGGGTFSCSMTIAAERVEEGWNVRPVPDDSTGYLFKR